LNLATVLAYNIRGESLAVVPMIDSDPQMNKGPPATRKAIRGYVEGPSREGGSIAASPPSVLDYQTPPPQRPRNSALVVAGIYLGVLLVIMVGWIIVPLPPPSTNATIPARLGGAACQVTGPFAWLVVQHARSLAPGVMVAFLTWWLWLTVVTMTRLRDLPYWVHVTAVILWCCAGCPPVGVWVT
jgi:hypothetical protein